MDSKIQLTQTVQKGGCAAKVAATELREILSRVQFPENSSDVMVDGRHMDDAGIIKINSQLALVQTLDFFTPIVDSPYLFGQIAAANSLSDVYAMGGIPKTAMAILAFPLISMSKETIVDVLQGASDKLKESGVDFVGGHSIDDDTLKFGLSVTGHVHPEKIWKNSGAQAGDWLILTKPLGTGTATAALKRQQVSENDIQDEITSMSTLNDIYSLLSADQIAAIHAATDITGFGLAGHAVQMGRASQKTLMVNLSQVPRFKRAEEFLKAGYLTKAHRTNLEYVLKELGEGILSDLDKNLICDPQTSGGLLLSVSASLGPAVLKTLQSRFKSASHVGHVQDYNQIQRLSVQ